MKKYKIQIILLTAAIIATVSYFLLLNEKSIEVSTMKTYKGNITKTIDVSGAINSKDVEVIPLQPSMDVVKTYVKENDIVEANQLLAELDSKDLIISLLKANLNLEELTEKLNETTTDNSKLTLLSNTQSRIKEEYLKISTDLETAKEEINKAKILYNENAISKAEYDKYASAVNNLTSALKAAELNLEDSKINYQENNEQKKQDILSLERQIKSIYLDIESLNNKIDDTKIYSSINGIVTEFSIEEFRKTLSGEQITIHGTETYELTAKVAQKDAVLITVGLESIITIDGLNASYKGVVTQISKTAEIENSGSMLPKVEIKIEIINPDEFITFGYEGEAKIIIDEKEDALIIKNESVKMEGERKFVYVLDGNIAKKKYVETGLTDGYLINIENGINENDVVIVNPPFNLFDGINVKAIK